MNVSLHGALVTLRPATDDDIPALARIRATPEVFARWRGGAGACSPRRATTGSSSIPPPTTRRPSGATPRSGFRPVGVIRRYERDPDGSWHDGLMMDLPADDLLTD
jgi:RimJ/RimL family protein N-acetyltransferase